MVQTITIRSDNSYDINTGSVSVDQSIDIFSADLSAKITSIISSMLSDGIVEVHSERDTWRQFEHARSASGVDGNDIGTIISVADFDWIISEVANAIAEAEAAAAAAQPEDPAPEIL